MFQQVIAKCTAVVVKNGTKIAVAGIGSAVLGTASVISYNIGRKRGDKEGQKKASEIYEKKFKNIAAMFD